MLLSDDDKRTVVAILRTHAAIQDNRAMDGTNVLARLQVDEPDNPLTLAVREGLDVLEADCNDLLRIARTIEADISS